MEIKRQFVRYTSHEVCTPLNVYLGLLELLNTELGLLENLSQEISKAGESPVSQTALHNIREVLRCWQELLVVARSSDSAVDELKDLLNHDKIKTDAIHVNCRHYCREHHPDFPGAPQSGQVAAEWQGSHDDIRIGDSGAWRVSRCGGDCSR